MNTTISGKFDSTEDARRAAARLAEMGIPPGAIDVVEHREHSVEQSDGLRGVTDGSAAPDRLGTVTVRASDPEHARRAAEMLRSTGARDVEVRDSSGGGGTGASGGIAAAGAAFGMAIADAATSAMAGVSASKQQDPGSGPAAGGDRSRAGTGGDARWKDALPRDEHPDGDGGDGRPERKR
jgi:hypothetical protein